LDQCCDDLPQFGAFRDDGIVRGREDPGFAQNAEMEDVSLSSRRAICRFARLSLGLDPSSASS
jgi:hypothetical protein